MAFNLIIILDLAALYIVIWNWQVNKHTNFVIYPLMVDCSKMRACVTERQMATKYSERGELVVS